MGWLYHRTYVGPDRRAGRFHVRFFERRKDGEDTGTRASVQSALRDLFSRGLKWVDVISYFGPDRRSGAFSHFFRERRRHETTGLAPPLRAALRQLRVRVLELKSADGGRALQERLIATAILADAQGRAAVGDALMRLADRLAAAAPGEDLSGALQSQLLAAEAMLDDAGAREA